MSRGLIGAGIAVLILALVALTNVVTVGQLQKQTEHELENRSQRLRDVVRQLGQLESLGFQKSMEQFAIDQDLGRAIRSDNPKQRYEFASGAFSRFRERQKQQGENVSDIWLLDREALVVAKPGLKAPTEITEFKSGDKVTYPEIQLAIEQNATMSTFWVHQDRLLRVGIAPILEIVADTNQSKVIGVVVVGTEVTSTGIRKRLNEEIAFFHDDTVYATTLDRESGGKDGPIAKLLRRENMADRALRQGAAPSQMVTIKGHRYMAAAARLPRSSTRSFPKDYPYRAGVVVMLSVDNAVAPLASVGTLIWLLGLAAAVLALIGIALVARRHNMQIDQMRAGVDEVIRGNIDYIFPPVGKEADGLAHGLNVMLARLLGRPEPGEDGFGEGSLDGRGSLAFEDDAAQLSDKDASNVALAQEPEQDYYKRIFEEYVSAKRELGEASDIAFDKFITKVRLSEGNLKERFQCEAVRFRIIIKDNKVTLKPVPIL